MFRRILVTVDGSDQSVRAIRAGRLLAERAGASLVLLRVAPRRAPGRGSAAIEADLRRQVERLRETGLSVTGLVESGPPGDTIVAAARGERVDLVIVAPHRRAGAGALGLRSVTTALLSRSPAPLLILPADATSSAAADFLLGAAAPIIVSLDDSATAERALPTAVDAATTFDQPLLLVRVVQPLLSSGVAETEARQYLDALRQLVAAEGAPPVATSVVTGPPADAILWTAEGRGASLIVMSTHGRGDIARAALGSVTTEVARHAATPLLVIPVGRPVLRPEGPTAIQAAAGDRGD